MFSSPANKSRDFSTCRDSFFFFRASLHDQCEMTTFKNQVSFFFGLENSPVFWLAVFLGGFKARVF
jgi:hypothetical protein